MSIYKNILRLLTRHSRIEKCKALKKELNEELILIAWHPRRWWNICMLEDEKKEIKPFFTE